MMALDNFIQESGVRLVYEYLKWKYERGSSLLLHYQFIFSFRIHLIFLTAWPITMSDEENKQSTEPTMNGREAKEKYVFSDFILNNEVFFFAYSS
jgi:hypothetical protein